MLESVKEVLNKDIDLASVKEVLTKDIELNNLVEMDAEIKKLKKVLATEIKLKEFLVQEIDIKQMFFGGSNNKNEQTEIKGEAESIPEEIKLPPYDMTLVNTLKKEQKGILFIYKELMRYAKDRNYAQVQKRLEQFSTVMKQHYSLADKELYSYLRSYIHLKFPKREKAFNELSLEMKNISIETFFSITQSPNLPLNDETYYKFMSEFTLLGYNINKRIQREEEVLFKMYEESNKARDIA